MEKDLITLAIREVARHQITLGSKADEFLSLSEHWVSDHIIDKEHLFVWKEVDFSDKDQAIRLYDLDRKLMDIDKDKYLMLTISSGKIYTVGWFYSNSFSLRASGNFIYYSVDSAIKDTDLNLFKTRVEINCKVCGRANDFGVAECWLCGNKP